MIASISWDKSILFWLLVSSLIPEVSYGHGKLSWSGCEILRQEGNFISSCVLACPRVVWSPRPTWLLRPLPGAGILTSSKDEEELGWTFISSKHKTLRKIGFFSHKSMLLLSFQGIVEYCSGCQVDSSFICWLMVSSLEISLTLNAQWWWSVLSWTRKIVPASHVYTCPQLATCLPSHPHNPRPSWRCPELPLDGVYESRTSLQTVCAFANM